MATALLACGLLLFSGAAVAWAEFRETFETPTPSWRLAEADCPAQLTAHERTWQQFHGGRGSERMSVTAGHGSFVYLAHDVPRSPVISELTASVWVKSDRPGVQLLVRVVLPRWRDPRTGLPLTTLLHGDAYSKPGVWQRLTIDDLPRRLSQQAPVLRTQFGSDVDPREAYLDLVVLNAYGGRGVTNVWIDDLEVTGVTTMEPSPASAEPAGASPPGGGAAVVAPAAHPANPSPGEPVFPRLIDHHGEPFAWLQRLGFNTVRLMQPPTADQVAEARRLGLWLVAPPPAGVARIDSAATDRILAWDFGRRLDERHYDATRQFVGEVRHADAASRRPLVAGVDGDIWRYSRTVDILGLALPPIASSRELSDAARGLTQRSRLARSGAELWAIVPTELPVELLQQWRLAPAAPLSPPTTIEPEQLRLLTYAALAGGARGVAYRSTQRLDGEDAASRLRSAMLEAALAELELLAPWTIGVQSPLEIELEAGAGRAAVLPTPRATLVLASRGGPHQQWAAGGTRGPLSLTIPAAPAAAQAYLVSPTKFELLRGQRTAGGLRVQLPEAGLCTAIVVTQDPLVLDHLQRTVRGHRRRAARVAHELAARIIELHETTTAALGDVPGAPTATALAQARLSLAQCERLLDGDDPVGSTALAERALTLVAADRRRLWEAASAGFPSPAASPWCASFMILPTHYALATRLRQATWGENLLPGGDMEDLALLQQAGWSQTRREQPGVRTHVELSPTAPRSGSFALRLHAWPEGPEQAPAQFDRPLIEIGSAATPVRQGQFVQIRGYVRTAGPIVGSLDGLLIADSLGGDALAERIPAAPAWREFCLYRFAPADGSLTVRFRLQGLGDVQLDDVTIAPVVSWGSGAPAADDAFDTARRER